MTYLVFSQEPKGLPDAERLAGHAARFFGTQLERVGGGPDWLHVRVSSAKPVFQTELALRARSVTRDDLEEARGAEARGRAAGMSALAERCPYVLELGPIDGHAAQDAGLLALAGVCASVVLGPILPPDRSTLFGVRGAMERLDLLR
jgi:hypothetical protein